MGRAAVQIREGASSGPAKANQFFVGGSGVRMGKQIGFLYCEDSSEIELKQRTTEEMERTFWAPNKFG